MTKRTNNFQANSPKKQKINDDIDALWGDDLDESILDDCLIRATQVLEEEQVKLNASVLPSYNVFKDPGKIFASTQLDTYNLPCSSRHTTELDKNNVNNNNYEKEIQKLQQQCEEKDGEVAILRTQLKESRYQYSNEQHKFQNEWKNKLNITEKQFQSVKSELEFKNLEIANLKQKISEITKRTMNTTINAIEISNTRQAAESQQVESPTKQFKLEKNKLHVISEPDYPLKNLAETVLGAVKVEKYTIEKLSSHSARNSIPYLKNQMVSTKIIIEENKVDMDVLLPIILQLSKLNSEELNHRDNLSCINKLIGASLQLLEDLKSLLENIKFNLSTEDILEADSLYLNKNSSNEGDKDEMGLKSGYILNFLAELLPHNEYFKTYIFNDKPLTLTEDLFLINLPYIASKRIHGGFTFMKKMIDVVKIIGEIRKAEAMTTFLRSTIKFFTNVCRLKKYECLSEIFCEFTKELIFLRPPANIIGELTFLFKEASQYSSFVEFLLNRSKNASSTKKGIVYFTNDACRFYIFVLMFERYMSDGKTIPLDVCLNLLCFIYNTYKTAFFIHHKNTKECDCLSALYKLEIEIVFRALEKYIEESKRKQKNSEWGDFFKNKITIKVMNLMTFHSYESMEKYITVYSQYKEIERHLQENDLWNFEHMNIHEDVPEIDSSNFDNIGFD